MEEHQRRVARARLLRRSGKTHDEIRAVLGPVSDDALREWLRGIPRPSETLRSRALDDLRRECRRLRAQGLTYTEIAQKTGASKGSISPWVRDVVLTDAARARHRSEFASSRRRAADAVRAHTARRAADADSRARALLGAVTLRDLFVVGVVLYWAEGEKDKPWRRTGRVSLINSDPDVIARFLAWLDLMAVAESDRRYRLSIHKCADVAAAQRWWADRVGIEMSAFARATLKRHRPKTVRRNSGNAYHGCLIVTVARSRALYEVIAAAWRALVVDGERSWQASSAGRSRPTA